MKKLVIRFNSPVVLCFALLSLLALLLGDVTGGAATTRVFCVYRSSLADPLTYLRLFTHVLGHAGYSHYMGNMLLLLLVGPPLEEKYGSRRLLVCIAITALVSGLVQVLLFPGAALLGASGIVFMCILLSSLSGMRGGAIPLTLILVAVFYLGGEWLDALILVVILYLGGEVVDAVAAQDSVSQLTHIVGGLCGAALGFAMSRFQPFSR